MHAKIAAAEVCYTCTFKRQRRHTQGRKKKAHNITVVGESRVKGQGNKYKYKHKYKKVNIDTETDAHVLKSSIMKHIFGAPLVTLNLDLSSIFEIHCFR